MTAPPAGALPPLPEPALDWPTGVWLRNSSRVLPGTYYTAEQMREYALLAALRLREWRPIESAPEDTPIWLVDAENTMWVGVHVYVENEGYAWTNCYRDFDYHNGKWQTSTADWDDDYQPIGWQPLPEPPTADDLARVLEEGK